MEAGKQLLDQFWASDLCQNDLIGIGQRLDRKCGFGLALPLSEAVSSLHQIQKMDIPAGMCRIIPGIERLTVVWLLRSRELR
jgi:hypothetical protein